MAPFFFAAVGCDTRDPAAVPLHTVEAVSTATVELALKGMTVGHEPEGHRAVNPWIPIASLQPEGAGVERGEALLDLSADAVGETIRSRDLQIAEHLAQGRADEASTDQMIRDVRDQQATLRQRLGVLDAQIASTHRRDEEEIAVARLEVERARDQLRHAERVLERVRKLGTIVGAVEVREAERAYALAAQDVRIPEAELDYFESLTRSVTRRLLELDRRIASLELGGADDSGGLDAEIAKLTAIREAEASVGTRDVVGLQRYQSRDRGLLEDSAVRAQVEGVVRYREGGLGVGHTPRRSSAIYVIRNEDLSLEFDLPQRWRHLVTVVSDETPKGDGITPGRVRIDVPALGLAALGARVRSISTRPYPTRRGRAYRCHVLFDHPVPGLRDGMSVDVRVPVPVSDGALKVPRWCVGGEEVRWVTMADGSRRSVRGWSSGAAFIVEEGLVEGERVQAMILAERKSGFRITGIVEPRESVQIQVPWRVEILEMLDEGSRVRKGEVIATLSVLRGDMMRASWEEQIARQRTQGESDLVVARMEALSQLRRRHAAWHRSKAEVAKAQLLYLVERYGSYGEEEIAGDVAREQARIAWQEAQDALDDLRAAAAGDTVSAHGLRDGELALHRAVLELEKQELKAVAALRRRDWVAVWEKQEEVAASEEGSAEERSSYSLQREQYHLEHAQAIDAYQASRDRVQRLRKRQAREIVRAPHDGRLFYNFDDRTWRAPQFRPLKVGRRLRTTRPFYMPVDERRVVRLEVPSHLHGRLDAGTRVPVYASVFRGRPVSGTVVEASPFFHVSREWNGESLSRGTLGGRPMVYTVTIALELTEEQARRLPYGVQAWIRLET